jgi:HK97 family phage major capsid protein
MEKPTLEEIGQAVTELRAEVKKAVRNPEKEQKIHDFLDTAEEKVIQPLARAAQEIKNRENEVKDLQARLEASGKTGAEVKARVDALEAELARGDYRSKVERNYKEGDEYKALNGFCRQGLNGMTPEHKALLRTDSAVDGGFLTTTEMDTEITKKITEIDPIRSVARVRSTASKSLELPIRNTIPVATYEGEADTGADSASAYQNETVVPYRQTFTVPITMDMLMNAAFDMDSEIMSDAAEAFAFGEGNGFVVGTGFKQPAGFVNNATLQAAARLSGVSGVLTPNSIILLTGDLKVGYAPVYVLNRRTLALIRTFRGDAASPGDAAGQFLWLPGMNGPVAATLNGFPYILANSMPDVAASAFPIAFGDFRRGYTIVDRTGISVIRDEFTLKKKAIVEFTLNRWNTGRVTLPEAIKLLQITA